MNDALSYIDPNTFQHLFGGPLGQILAFVLAGAGFFFRPIRRFFTFLRLRATTQSRFIGVVLTVLIGTFSGVCVFGLFSQKPTLPVADSPTAPRVILIGMDGLEPTIVEEMMAKGELPHFSKLAQQGGYKRIATSNPAESPVAWSTIATGCDPGEHGVFDFLHRDPKSYLPELSLRKAIQGISGTRYEKARQRDGFWVYTSGAGIPTNVIRWPVAFPAEAVNGHFLSGFGTPDLTGGEGKYHFFTSSSDKSTDPSFRNVVAVEWNGSDTTSALPGPAFSSSKPSEIPVRFRRTSDNRLEITAGAAKAVVVGQNEWSTWTKVSFRGGFRELAGIVKFHVVEVTPNLRVVCSPIQIDPSAQALPLTCPDCFGAELEQKLGTFHTLGMPEQVHPLSHLRIGYDAFLAECHDISRERRLMFESELESLKSGLLAFVFDTSDRLQHAFWSVRDTQHPAYNAEDMQRYGHVIPAMYREMDEIVGRALQACDDRTTLLILSDHGFNSFRRAVHINRWLIANGYMTLKGGAQEGGELFRDVDWQKTRAYSLGFASIYVNRKGREGRGCVEALGAGPLCVELRERLLNWTDEERKERVLRGCYLANEIYSGAASSLGPDLVLGFAPGYRASWQTALGGAPIALIEDNKKKWSGDHLIDPSCVPGVLFSNRIITTEEPHLRDIAPTVLRLFNLPQQPHMQGQAIQLK